MRKLLTAAALTLAACATLSGPAWADSTQPRSITVNGDTTRSISQSANQAAVDATYRATINDAINAAHLNATSVANKFGATLGPVLNFTENYGNASCANGDTSVQPTAGAGAPKSTNSGASKGGSLRLPPVKHHKRPHTRHRHAQRGHKANDNPTANCTIEASITMSYQIS